MIIDTSDLARVSLRQVRQAHPNVSLHRNPTDEHLAPLGYAILQPTERPTGDVVTEGTPEQGEDGTWHQTWEVRDYTTEEAAEALDQAKSRKLLEINTAYQAEMDLILKDYPDAETRTWDKQEAEARSWQTDSAFETPLIDAIASARSMDKGELVARIIAKADAWISLSGAATGKRQALEDDIDAAYQAEDREALESVSWTL